MRFFLRCLTVILVLSSARAAIIGQWELDDVSGAVATATAGPDGTYIDLAATDYARAASPGDVTAPQNAIAINGATGTGRIQLGNVTTPDITAGEAALTVSLWVNFDNNTADHAILSNHNFSSSANLLWWRDESGGNGLDSMAIIIGGQRLEAPAGALSDAGRWYHLAFTFSGTNGGTDGEVEMFIDGSSVATLTSSILPASIVGSNPLTAGQSAQTGTRQFNGLMDEILIFDEVLSSTQIQNLAKAVELNISATVATTTEGDYENPATIVVSRTGSTASSLDFALSLGGSATPGSDYTPISTATQFAAGEVTRTYRIDSPSDQSVEGSETVQLMLESGPGYSIGPNGQATVTITDSPMNSWASAHFTPTELADPLISGPEADPDGDQYNNLAEFFAWTDPRTTNGKGFDSRINHGSGSPSLELSRNPDAASLGLMLETSTDLANWISMPSVTPAVTLGTPLDLLTFALPDTNAEGQYWRVAIRSPETSPNSASRTAFFSFDSSSEGNGNGSSSTSFGHNYPQAPVLSFDGSNASLQTGGASYLAPDGILWQGNGTTVGHSLIWDAQSTDNHFRVGFSAYLQNRIKIRFDTCATGFVGEVAFESLTYDTGFGPVPVPDAALEITADGTFREWSIDLSGLTAIEGRSEVALIWSLPDLNAGESIRIDNLLITSEGRAKSRLVRNLEAGREQTIVRLGTSLTNTGSWGPDLIDLVNQTYPDLGAMVNSGASGKYSAYGEPRVQGLVLDHDPDTVFIEYSINDSVIRFNLDVDGARANLESIIDQIHAVIPDCEIILMTMTPGDGFVGDPDRERVQIEDHYQMYRDVAAERGFLLIDHYSSWQALNINNNGLFRSYVSDTIHPSSTGNRAVVSPVIHETLGLTSE